MDPLLIQFKKKADGSSVLHCLRPDGSATWQRRQGPFFALHDLGHYAIETVLGLRYGFFGMLAEGWNITDFGTPWPRGPIPDYAREDAMLAESLAGFLDAEHATGARHSAADFNDKFAADHALERHLTEAELSQIRAKNAALIAQWTALPIGEALALSFTLKKAVP